MADAERYIYICMQVKWTPEKASANLNKHSVRFADAEAVLFDPYALTREDDDAEGEQRFVALGEGGNGQILIVVYAYRDSVIRLISAWPANQKQKRRYEENRLRQI